MTSLIEKLKELRPNVKDSTIRSYAKQLKKVNNGKDVSNFKFLNNTSDILSRLAQKKEDGSFKYSPSAQKLMLASILVALKKDEKMSKAYDIYLKKAQEMSKAYYNGLAENRKTQRQSDNWVSIADLMKVVNDLVKKVRRRKIARKPTSELTSGDKQLLQDYLIASLYTLHNPRRNVYADTRVISEKDFQELSGKERDSNNYLVVQSRNKKYFSLADYKTRRSHGVQKIPLVSKLNTVVNIWRKHNPDSEWLLHSRNGSKLTKNRLTKEIQRIFSATGKRNIGSTQLRHIFISEKTDNKAFQQMQKMAEEMGHSVQEQQQTYYKKD